MTTETHLQLGNLIIPVGAGRGISQTIDLVVNGVLRRTVNGTLLDLTRDQNRKFVSKVTAADQKTPTFAGFWIGQQLVVDCFATIRQLLSSPSTTATLMRQPVTGTVFGRDSSDVKVAPTSVAGLLATFPTAVSYVEFAPELTMLIANISTSTDEYSSLQTWEVDLEEV